MKFYTHIAASILFALMFSLFFDLGFHIFYFVIAIFSSVILDLIEIFTEKHKRQTHNIFVLLATLPVCYLNFNIGFGLFTGIFSHLILDLLSVTGVPLLYPVKKYKFVSFKSENRIRTGSIREKAFFIFIVILILSGLLACSGLCNLVDDNVNSAIDAGNSYSSNGHYSGGYNGQNHGNNRYGYNTGPVSINLYTDTSNAITEGEINTNGTLMNQTISYGVPETNDSE